jgi:cytochrome bd-type quinol oxidase subunit 2
MAGGLVGVLQAVVLLLVPASVASDRYSYPFGPRGYALAQVTFFLQHLLLLAGLWVLARSPGLRSSRAGRAAAGAAVVGMALLAVLELVAVTAADESTTSDRAQLVNNLYSVPVLLLGVALVVAGVVALRAPRAAWAGAPWLPLVVLALGVYVFIPLTPAIMGPFVAGRLGIGGWMLLFGVLGAGLARLDDDGRVQ